ncbi:MAG: acetate/propionate family kinase [Candidatus Acidiferrum sp.]|jgi:acetate kinase
MMSNLTMSGDAVFVVNSGSSSLKFGVFAERERDGHAEVRALYRGAVEGIGGGQGKIWLRTGTGEALLERPQAFPAQTDAARAVARELSEMAVPSLRGVGHRVVHGGPSLTTHQKITPEVLQKLEAAAHFAPLHVPVALELIRETQQLFPGVSQFACFDTAFHRTLPEAAARLPLPEKFWDAGVRRYGFHGLSCESIVHALGVDVPARLIVAHLGNGASVTAIAKGLSVDTTMGLTPTGGIVMGTRPGDLDPGVSLHILRGNGNNVEGLERVLDKESGLLGISGTSPDMRSLHEAADENPRARLAIEMFARSAKKAIGSYVAVLGGLDLLVFTGGIGEHDGAVREKICEGMECFGVRPDREANQQSAGTISSGGSAARVRVVTSDEERQIARIVFRLTEDD